MHINTTCFVFEIDRCYCVIINPLIVKEGLLLYATVAQLHKQCGAATLQHLCIRLVRSSVCIPPLNSIFWSIVLLLWACCISLWLMACARHGLQYTIEVCMQCVGAASSCPHKLSLFLHCTVLFMPIVGISKICKFDS